jgi:hypothetical protein
MARRDEIFFFDGTDRGLLVGGRRYVPEKGIDDENHPRGNRVHKDF